MSEPENNTSHIFPYFVAMTAEEAEVFLTPGTKVRKTGGYPYPGVVVTAFNTTAGHIRYVVEATGEDYKGMLHIFNREQLEEVK